ncbi:site-specific integrase [bacterium]|nr:site-specific integrase [bacterium]
MGRKQSQYRGVRAASQTTIEIDFQWNGKRHRHRLKLKPTPSNLAKAAQHRAAILSAIDHGTFDPRITLPDSKLAKGMGISGLRISVAELLDLWIREEERHLKKSTLNGYIKIINSHLRPNFGEIWIDDLSSKIVRNYMRELKCSDKTKRNVLSPLRIAFEFAVAEDLIKANPLSDLRIRKTKGIPKVDSVDPFTGDERDRILAAVTGQARNLLQFALYTGLRTSELVALDWGDIDLTQRRARISRAITQHSSEPELPKTSAGLRDLKLNTLALEALENQRAFTQLNGEEVFQNPRTGKRWTGDQPIRKTLWESALKKAGVKYRNPYQTRHTFASMMLTAGESVAWLSKQMGHKDVAFTLRTYARFIEDDRSDAGDKFEQWQSNHRSLSKNRTPLSSDIKVDGLV